MRKLRDWLENAPSLSPISPPNLFCLSTKNFLHPTNQGASPTPHPSQECRCMYGEIGSHLQLMRQVRVPNALVSKYCNIFLADFGKQYLKSFESCCFSNVYSILKKKQLSNIVNLDKLCLCQKHYKVKTYSPPPIPLAATRYMQ